MSDSALDRLVSLLQLERLDRDLFRGHNPSAARHGRLFGGHVAAQALQAAAYTVETDHHPHSLHGYFLRPGQLGRPSILQVHRIRDGRSFTTRRIVVVQDGEAIFSLSASFHHVEPGGEYQIPVSDDVAPPETLAARDEDSNDHMSPFDVREVLAEEERSGRSTRQVWVRTNGDLPGVDDDRALHACLLTYMSDMGAVGAARRALGIMAGGGSGRASTMRCGSTGRSAPTVGCCSTCSRRRLRVRGRSSRAACTTAGACTGPRWRRRCWCAVSWGAARLHPLPARPRCPRGSASPSAA